MHSKARRRPPGIWLSASKESGMSSEEMAVRFGRNCFLVRKKPFFGSEEIKTSSEIKEGSECGNSLGREKSSEKNTDPFGVKFNSPCRK
jgi:hypothetical protein